MNDNNKLILKLAALAVGMFGFAFALVPIYDLICEITGLGGDTGGQYTYDAAQLTPDRSRLVKVNFITNTNDGMVWEFTSEKGGMRVFPGELKEVNFKVRNPTDRPMIGRAIPSVVPLTATDHFHKTECFCFEQQFLGPGEEAIWPMRFLIAPELPKNVQSINLSYALFDVTELVSRDLPIARTSDEG